MRLLCVFALVAVVGLVAGEEGARLLASKSLLNRYAVEGRDLTLQYSIYNVGTRYCPLGLRSSAHHCLTDGGLWVKLETCTYSISGIRIYFI